METPSLLRPLSRSTVTLHWLVAAGIIGLLVFGFIIAATPSGPEKTALIQIHKSFGVVVGLFALWRIIHRIREGWPPAIQPASSLESRAARTAHLLMLAATFAMPLSGIMKSVTYARPVDVFGFRLIPPLIAEKNEFWNEVASNTHAVIGFILAALVILHVLAALKHHFFNRNVTLLRMAGLSPPRNELRQ